MLVKRNAYCHENKRCDISAADDIQNNIITCHTPMDHLKQIRESFDAAVVGYLELSDSLTGELKYLLENHEDDLNQYWRRTFIRASWSLVDGYIYALKEMCRAVSPLRSDDIEKSDEHLLSNARQETGDKIKGVLKLAIKIFDSVTLDFSGSDWGTVKHSIEKRHNVVHPKSAATLFVTDDEWRKQRAALEWYISTFNSLLVALQKKYQ